MKTNGHCRFSDNAKESLMGALGPPSELVAKLRSQQKRGITLSGRRNPDAQYLAAQARVAELIKQKKLFAKSDLRRNPKDWPMWMRSRALTRSGILSCCSGATIAVLWAWAERADNEDCTSFVGASRLARDTGLALRSVRRALSILAEWHILVTEQSSENTGRSTVRRLHFPENIDT